MKNKYRIRKGWWICAPGGSRHIYQPQQWFPKLFGFSGEWRDVGSWTDSEEECRKKIAEFPEQERRDEYIEL